MASRLPRAPDVKWRVTDSSKGVKAALARAGRSLRLPLDPPRRRSGPCRLQAAERDHRLTDGAKSAGPLNSDSPGHGPAAAARPDRPGLRLLLPALAKRGPGCKPRYRPATLLGTGARGTAGPGWVPASARAAPAGGAAVSRARRGSAACGRYFPPLPSVEHPMSGALGEAFTPSLAGTGKRLPGLCPSLGGSQSHLRVI